MGQNRTRGKRYSSESKLNYAKILAVVVAIAVIIMFAITIKQLLSYDITKFMAQKEYFAVYSENKWGVINSVGETIIAPSIDVNFAIESLLSVREIGSIRIARAFLARRLDSSIALLHITIDVPCLCFFADSTTE